MSRERSPWVWLAAMLAAATAPAQTTGAVQHWSDHARNA
jgi:hypothetical protein